MSIKIMGGVTEVRVSILCRQVLRFEMISSAKESRATNQ
jgi:hypothetical protein